MNCTLPAGYHIAGYRRLIQNLDTEEKEILKKPVIQKELTQFVHETATSPYVAITQKTAVTALLALREGLIPIQRVATMFMIAAAINELYQNPSSHMIWNQFDSKIQDFRRHGTVVELAESYGPACFPFHTQHYLKDIRDREMYERSGAMKYFRPTIQRHFQMNEKEWSEFQELMNQELESEQCYTSFPAPVHGSWSGIVSAIGALCKTFKPLKEFEIVNKAKGKGLLVSRICLPSFSMVQNYLKVKCKFLNRPVIQLVSVLGPLTPDEVSRMKAVGLAALGLWCPEFGNVAIMKKSHSNFMKTIDGWAGCGPLSFALHDIFHAFRDAFVTVNFACGLSRLALIAKNSKSEKGDAVAQQLLDGDVLSSYAPEDTHVVGRGSKELFGRLFQNIDFTGCPHLKVLFIQDIEANSRSWREELNIGPDDLLDEERKMYFALFVEEIKKMTVQDRELLKQGVPPEKWALFFGNS